MENLFKPCTACRKTPFSCLCRPILTRTPVSYMNVPILHSKYDILNQHNHSQSRRIMTRIQKK